MGAASGAAGAGSPARGRRRRLTTAVGWACCAAAAVAVLAQAPAAAAQQQEAAFAPVAAGVGARGHVRRREQQQEEAADGAAASGVRTGGAGVGFGRIRGLLEGGGGAGAVGDVGFEFLQQYGLAKAPGPLALTPDRKNLYTVTGESLVAFKVQADGTGRLEQIQELRDGVVDKYGNTVDYFTGLTAVASSPDGDSIYAVGTSVMPGVGGITVLGRDKASGELSVAQQFKIDQSAGVADIEGMIGANSVAVSPDGKFAYVSSGGYYRDHNLLVFKRQVDGADKGRLSLLQNIDIYNTSASRVLPSTLAVAPDGKHVYVIGDNFAISTSAILVYSVDQTTGQLTQVQEAGPFRGTLLTSAGFDPRGQFLYAAASFGNNLVWAFSREPDGRLTTVVDPMLPTGAHVDGPEGGSYAAVLPLDVNGLPPFLLVAVEKANAVYAAERVVGGDGGGRLSYFASRAEEGLKRPVALAFDPDAKLLFVAEAGDNAISAFRVAGRG